MNFLLRLSVFVCAAVFTGMILSGCGTTTKDEPVFNDNPNAPAMSESPTNGTQSAAARFRPGETVVVATSTGSDGAPGPVAATGQNFLIADDGTISLPFIGKIQAAGKTPSELQDDINNLYVPQYYVHLITTVTGIYRVYYVGGEVTHPGPEVYNGQTTVTMAIQAAGDLTTFAKHTIWLTRADGTRIEVDYDAALSDSSKDLPVFPGDKLEVHRRIF
jgi:protein involved in polysaccharide export with SLBB domain